MIQPLIYNVSVCLCNKWLNKQRKSSTVKNGSVERRESIQFPFENSRVFHRKREEGDIIETSAAAH